MTNEELDILEQKFMELRSGDGFDRALLRLIKDATDGDEMAIAQLGKLETMYAKINHG